MQRLLARCFAPSPPSSLRALSRGNTGVPRYKVSQNFIQHPRFSTNMTITNDWRPVSNADIPSYNVYTKPVQKFEQDDREYRVIRLQNGLEAVLVHDAKADKAAASLDVAVGHLYDPDDMPGLAHFCEHLLFMGTEQYPKENEYSEYLAKNNGSSNAYTGTSNTNYYFSVATNALPGALSRFAAFFHCPLFAPSCTTRELNAVNSEHKKNHQSDIWRMFQLNKHLTKPGHPWSKFGSGNMESLSKAAKQLKEKGLLKAEGYKSIDGSLAATPIPSRAASPAPSISSAISDMDGDGGAVGRETRRRLVEWWSKEYSAERMRLCVIGKESLDELSDIVSNLFSPISSRGSDPLPMIDDHPFGSDEMGTLVRAETIMSFHAVEVSFPLPYQPPFWRHQPGNYLAHFIGHEGPGSLHSYLKQKGWITALSAGPQPLARGFAMFKCTLHLTTEGFEHYKEALLSVFKYLSLLRESKFPAWTQREISELKATRFRFSEKRRPDDYAVWVSEHMSWPVPRDKVLAAPQLVEPWDEADPVNGGELHVREILDTLTIDRGRAVLMAKKEEHERLKNTIEWQHEPWYGTSYVVEKFDDDLKKQAQASNDIKELHLPGPNQFIPTNLNVDKRDVEKSSERPYLVRETPLSSLWHKKDDRFWVPKAQVIIDIRSPIAGMTARTATMTRLYGDLVTDSLTEFAYDADLAGLNYMFTSHNSGLYITLSGYNDRLHVLAQDILERARNLQVNAERLQVVKQQVKRDWENFFLGQPFRISDYFARYLMSDKQWTMAERLLEIPSITVEELQTHIAELLSRVKIHALVVGNMYKDESIRLIEMTEQIIQASPAPSPILELARIPAKSTDHIWNIPVPNPNEPNSALSYYIHIGSFLEPHLRVTAALLIQILSEPAFNILRTREQLGYVVSCSQWNSLGDAEFGLRVVIQSERTPAYLEERVEAFFNEMLKTLQEIGDEEFKEHKAGLERRWSEDVKNLNEEANRFWAQIDHGWLDFYRRPTNVATLREIKKSDVLHLFRSYIHHSSPTRSKVSVHLHSQNPRPKRFSEEAMLAFEENIRSRGYTINTEEWREELFESGEPLLSQVVAFWTRSFASRTQEVPPEVAKEFVDSLASLADASPALGDYEGKVPEKVKTIQDPKEYKATLRVSDPPKPVVEWGDLPTSRF